MFLKVKYRYTKTQCIFNSLQMPDINFSKSKLKRYNEEPEHHEWFTVL